MEKPFMQFWVNDYVRGVKNMTLEQKGLYVDLIMELWDVGYIPDNEKILAQSVKCNLRLFKRVFKLIRHKFETIDGLLFHNRVTIERLKIGIKKENGRNAAYIRHNIEIPTMQTQNTQTQTQTQSKSIRAQQTLDSKEDAGDNAPVTEPEQKVHKKTHYSKQTGLAISRVVNRHHETLKENVLIDSLEFKRLFVDLLSIPEMETEQQRTLAYLIQAKTVSAPQNNAERLSYAVQVLKAAKYTPADYANTAAKELIIKWNSDSDGQKRLENLTPNKNATY